MQLDRRLSSCGWKVGFLLDTLSSITQAAKIAPMVHYVVLNYFKQKGSNYQNHLYDLIVTHLQNTNYNKFHDTLYF